jgi:hypothetical protein
MSNLRTHWELLQEIVDTDLDELAMVRYAFLWGFSSAMLDCFESVPGFVPPDAFGIEWNELRSRMSSIFRD